jgi:lysophospholipase L1-like esterase
MIGTNNISIGEKPEKIARGIVELTEAIRRRQPQAYIHVLKVFPRKDKYADVKAVNQLLTQMLRTDERTDLIDLTPVLTLPSGQIDPTLYGTDGLHPAAKGYEKVAQALQNIVK